MTELDPIADITSTQPPIPPDEVIAQMGRILNSEAFRRGARISRFLQYVVEQTLAGKSSTLKQGTIAQEVYGRDINFDPRLDPIVRIEARRLRRELEEYYRVVGPTNSIRISVPKGHYVPRFDRLKAPPRNSTSTQPDQARPRVTEHGGPSVAVAHFDSMQPDNDAALIGISDELVSRLTSFSDVLVIGPLSPESASESPIKMARRVRAGFLLNGSTRSDSERVRVSVSLIETGGGTTLWAQNYTREIQQQDRQSIQSDIVSEIAGTIADDFGVLARTLSANLEERSAAELTPYEATLFIRAWQDRIDTDTLIRAHEALLRAIEVAPTYAVARAFLSDVYAIDHHLDIGATGHSQPLDRAEELAREAVELDRHCYTSAWCLGAVHFHRRRPQLSIAEFERSISLHPTHPLNNATSGLFLTMLGDYEQGTAYIRAAQKYNPIHATWYHFCLFFPHYCRGEHDEALAESLRFQSPDSFWPPLLRAAVLGQMGLTSAAHAELSELLKRFPDFEQRGAHVMRLTVYSDKHVRELLEGLEKAGLHSEPRG